MKKELQEVKIEEIITEYAYTWLLLHKYDKDGLEVKKLTKPKQGFNYEEAKLAIEKLKYSLVKKKEASDFFGNEPGKKLDGIVNAIYQTFDKKELYPSIEEKAAHLLYFVIKDHPFIDGNKRIGSFLFIVFLTKNEYAYKKSGEKKINDNALVALALLIAQSDPNQKDIMVKLIINLLQN